MATKMTREEAIKIVQSATVWTDEERDALAMLIPELAESEDERIRKWIVKFLVEQYPECWKDKKNKMLAYLEKQKEQKPVPPLPSYVTVTECRSYFFHHAHNTLPIGVRLPGREQEININ